MFKNSISGHWPSFRWPLDYIVLYVFRLIKQTGWQTAARYKCSRTRIKSNECLPIYRGKPYIISVRSKWLMWMCNSSVITNTFVLIQNTLTELLWVFILYFACPFQERRQCLRQCISRDDSPLHQRMVSGAGSNSLFSRENIVTEKVIKYDLSPFLTCHTLAILGVLFLLFEICLVSIAKFIILRLWNS